MIVVRIEMSRDKLFNIKTAHSIPNLKNVFKSASILFCKQVEQSIKGDER